MTPKQENWYRNALAEFAQPGNRYNGVTALTYCAACLGIPAQDVIADAHAHGIANRDADIRRGIETAKRKIGNQPSLGYRHSCHRPQQEQRTQCPDFVRNMIAKGGNSATPADIRALSPLRVADMCNYPQQQTAAFLSLYAPKDYLFIDTSDQHHTGQLGSNIKTRDEWLTSLADGELYGDIIGKNPLTGKQGKTGEGKASYSSAECIAAYRFALVEFDHLPLAKQLAFWHGFLQDPKRVAALAALTFSGNRSVHGLLRTNCPDMLLAPSKARELRDILCSDPDETYRADPATLRADGGTRLAGAKRRIAPTGTIQEIIYLSLPSPL